MRLLRADEIDVRVSTVSEKGCSLLLYKDARTDQNILDEEYGVFGWQRSHQIIGDRLYCTVSVKNPVTGEWISKQDVGTESYTEKEKGQASDSFKRACFNFGIGRELYTAPFIWVDRKYVDIDLKGKGYTTRDKFELDSIEYDDNRNICSLRITNTTKKVVCYEKKSKTGKKISDDIEISTDKNTDKSNNDEISVINHNEQTNENATDTKAEKVTASMIASIRLMLLKVGKSEQGMLDYMHRKNLADLTTTEYKTMMDMLEKWASKKEAKS